MFHLSVKGRRKEDGVSLLLELRNNVLISTDNFGLFLEGEKYSRTIKSRPGAF